MNEEHRYVGRKMEARRTVARSADGEQCERGDGNLRDCAGREGELSGRHRRERLHRGRQLGAVGADPGFDGENLLRVMEEEDGRARPDPSGDLHQVRLGSESDVMT